MKNDINHAHPQSVFRPNNWRPIANLHPLPKIFQRCVSGYIRGVLHSNGKLRLHQFQYRTKLSTGLLNVLLAQKVADFTGAGSCLDAVFLDCSKAFDRVDYETILAKLSSLGIHEKTIALLSSYLREKEQSVVVDGVHLIFLPATCGVAQGSIFRTIHVRVLAK